MSSFRAGRAKFLGRIQAFSLLEVLVSVAVLSLLVVLLSSIISAASTQWTRAGSRTEQFAEGQRAIDALSAAISRATLANYYEYLDARNEPRVAGDRTFVPATYGPMSDLRFAMNSNDGIFFQVPSGWTTDASVRGSKTALNTVGFRLVESVDPSVLPSFLPPKQTRPRLIQHVEPTERLSIYSFTNGNNRYTGTKWWEDVRDDPSTQHVVARNVVAFGLRARSSALSKLAFNSANDPDWQHQLPPLIDVALVVIDEKSAERLEASGGLAFLWGGNAPLTSASAWDSDLTERIPERLSDLNYGFRVFQTTVRMENAR